MNGVPIGRPVDRMTALTVTSDRFIVKFCAIRSTNSTPTSVISGSDFAMGHSATAQTVAMTATSPEPATKTLVKTVMPTTSSQAAASRVRMAVTSAPRHQGFKSHFNSRSFRAPVTPDTAATAPSRPNSPRTRSTPSEE